MSFEGPIVRQSPTGYDWYYAGTVRSLFQTSDQTLTPANGSTSVVDTFSGYRNPGYRYQIDHGQDATTNASGDKYSVDGNGLYSYSYSGVNPFLPSDRNKVNCRIYGKVPTTFPNPNGLPAADLIADVRNRAIRKFLDDAKSKRSSFEAGQDLGELKQTIESFIHPMKSLKDLTIKYFRQITKSKLKYRGKLSLHKALADSYLEYRFGWRPLALDLADAYAGLSNRRRMTNTAPCFGSASGERQTFAGGGLTSITGQDLLMKTESSYVRYSYRIKGAIRLNLDADGNIPVFQALQLQTLNDFAVTAWDLLPYSFVVDYFTNVGDIINSITFPTSDLTFCCGTERIEKIHKESYNAVSRQQPNDDILWSDTGTLMPNPSTSARVVRFNRSSLSSLDLIPTARFSLPVSSRPWENIGALITANTKKLAPYFIESIK